MRRNPIPDLHVALLSLFVLPFFVTGASAQGTRGIAIFEERCAQCHRASASPDNRAPDREVLRRHTPDDILNILTTGSMAVNATGLTADQKKDLAEYLSGRPLGSVASGGASAMPNHCASAAFLDPMKGPAWNGWGVDTGNSRFQRAASAGITADQVPKLKLKWAFGIPDASSMYSQPTVAGGRIYIGSDTGFVYSLDAASGCVYWSFRAQAGVRTAISIGPVKGIRSVHDAVYFGDIKANVYALNAESGEQLWTKNADPHPIARITGAPVLNAGRLYVPVSSLEEIAGANPAYECCTFRGSIIAYDANTGEKTWQSFMIPEAPKPTRKTSRGTQLWAPAGAPVWSAPTLDPDRGLIYVATGDAYTAPAPESTDAVLALDLKTGQRVWVSQLLADDVFLSGANCAPDAKDRSETCPPTRGPDFDFGSSPILWKMPGGHSIILIGQKSGIAWALDPAKRGAVIWQERVGKGTALGGIEFGSATDGRLAYFANADARFGADQAGGLAAMKIESGERIWFTRPPTVKCPGPGDPPCVQPQSAAITVIPGVVFSASGNGIMRAYAADDGHIVWEYDTAREFATVNGVPAKGGGISGPGPVVVGGMLFMNSGYAALGNGTPGNVLLAFGVQ